MEKPVSKTSAAKLKVLVADDEQVIANSLAAILNMSGFEARAVYNGRADVDALASFDFDILISDAGDERDRRGNRNPCAASEL